MSPHTTFDQTSAYQSLEDKRLRVAILGASGSIGTQSLDVCRQHRDKIDVVALSVNASTKELVAAAQEFKVSAVSVCDERHAHDSILSELPSSCRLGVGAQSMEELCSLDNVDCVICAVVGAAGIRAGYAALKAGKRLAYANKESLVVAGDLLMPLVKPGMLVPVDSEHSAIFQCLEGEYASELYKIWLTCSGGPFYGMKRSDLVKVSVHDALKHPTWSMGTKITIDSASLMNKGLEVLEAHHLFSVPVDDISVLIHRQSKIHSMVEFVDGSVKAQLGPSDMRIPIQYALSYPQRWESPSPRVDYSLLSDLSFAAPDLDSFGCLRLAYEAGHKGGTAPCVLNAANECANQAFQEERCSFLDIEAVVERTMDAFDVEQVESLEQLAELDAAARSYANVLLGKIDICK